MKEVRCQMRLPKGGKDSRLTLWVNGEPREAAFKSISKVKAGYKSVAVVQRRDPLLLQCFPVPARGEMKIRIGITSPLDDDHWVFPRVVERNFPIKGNLVLAGVTGSGKSIPMDLLILGFVGPERARHHFNRSATDTRQPFDKQTLTRCLTA